jgi:methylated-DNA-[protein]-cysteine S-methyltransferase
MVRFLQIARRIPASVGAALWKNPVWIDAPCHRGVGQSGKSVGFAGGLDTKWYLIELEKNRAIG